jgi:thiol-disulfide isomerase/thioredoxin
MKITLKLSVLIFFIGCNGNENLKGQSSNNAASKTKSELVSARPAVLFNKSANSIYFHYVDKFNLITQVTVQSQQAYNIEFDSVLYLIQSNQFQNIYKIDKKDTFKISVNGKGNIIPVDMWDEQEKNEFNLFSYINEHSKYSFMEFNSLSYKMHSYHYKTVDSIVRDRYTEQTSLLNRYCKDYPVSDRFKNFAEDYFRSGLLANLFSIPVNNKTTVPSSYFDYLNTLESEVIEKTNKVTEFMTVNLFHSFIRFKMLKLGKDKNLNRIFIAQIDSCNISKIAKQHQKVYIIGNMLTVGKQIDTSILRQFIKDYPGSEYSSYYETILSDINTSKSAGDNQLVQLDGKKVEYRNVLTSLKGKVVFIDVWASWCLPCRRQFENSKKLQEYFSGKQVEFLYISIDNSSAAWKKACAEEGISQKQLNYLLPDHDNSSFVKNLKISTIPKYIVIGKDGKIFNSTLSEEINEETKKVIQEALK